MRLLLQFLFALALTLGIASCGSDTSDNSKADVADVALDEDLADPVDQISSADQMDVRTPDSQVKDQFVPQDLAQPDLALPDTSVEDTALPDVTPPEDTYEAMDLTVPDEVALGTKKAGESCKEFTECADGMSCIAGQYTKAHCNPECTTDQDCLDASPGTKPTCQSLGGYQICIWYCGMFGGNAPCPGDLECDGATCG